MTNTLHAHVSTAASDCDGPTYHEYVVGISDHEVAGDFAEIEFRNRVLTSCVSVYSPGVGGLTVKADEDGFEWHEGTEEGYRAGEVRWCEDADCDPRAESHRDVYAEMMGY